MAEKPDLITDRIVRGGYCVGCGICAAASEKYSVTMTELGMYTADAKKGVEDKSGVAFEVCPFGAADYNEDQIASERFAKAATFTEGIGFHSKLYAGYVHELGYREAGSSGGMTSWILSELLRRDLVDAVIHVKPNSDPSSPILFEYGISDSLEEVSAGAKSRYYPVELSQVLDTVKHRPERFAVVGLPCFLKGLRRLCKKDKIIEQRLLFFVGLVCGHLKSTGFAESMAWQTGIQPGELKEVDFRKKLPNRAANRYGIGLTAIEGSNGGEKVTPMDELFGHAWGLGFFRNPACDFCDDVFAETADITLGDAWLPEYSEDWQGTNLVVVRDNTFARIVEQGLRDGAIVLKELQPSDATNSQAAGLRHRRRGLQHRLYTKRGTWTPQKRVQAIREKDRRYRRIFELRWRATMQSHFLFAQAKSKNNLNAFLRPMKRLSSGYNLLYSKVGARSAAFLPYQALTSFGALKDMASKVRRIKK